MSVIAKSSKRRAASPERRRPHKKLHTDGGDKLNGSAKSRASSPDSENTNDSDEPEVRVSDEIPDAVDDTSLKTNTGSRESHQAQKALLVERKAARPHADLLSRAKHLWSLIRQKNISKDERGKYIKELMMVVRGKIQDIVFKHDASRIIQTILKYGGTSERHEVAKELKGRYSELAQNRYSKFLVTKIFRYCPQYRLTILLEFDGHVMTLLLHREASSVVADFYELYANSYERALLLRNLYGKEIQLFSASFDKCNPSDEQKEQVKGGLKNVLTGGDANRRKRILESVKNNLETIFNNSEKGAVSHMIVHRVLLEYLMEIQGLGNDSDREKLRQEIFESCQENLADIVHTKDGSRAVREFIAQGSAKERKQIIKVLKPNIERICKDDEAQLVLFAALDIIDDTKLLAKSLISEIAPHAVSLLSSPQGRRSLLYLVTPRSSRHFTCAQVALISESDAVRSRTSKKDAHVRQDEIKKAASDWMIAMIEKKEKVDELLRDPGSCLVVCEIMLYADGDKSTAMQALLMSIANPYPSENEKVPHLIDIPHAARVFKTLLQGGHFSRQAKEVERVPTFSSKAFASAWLTTVGKKVTVNMATGTGAFVVAALCDRIREEGTDEEKSQIKGWIDKDCAKLIATSEIKGRDVLLESLALLKD